MSVLAQGVFQVRRGTPTVVVLVCFVSCFTCSYSSKCMLACSLSTCASLAPLIKCSLAQFLLVFDLPMLAFAWTKDMCPFLIILAMCLHCPTSRICMQFFISCAVVLCFFIQLIATRRSLQQHFCNLVGPNESVDAKSPTAVPRLWPQRQEKSYRMS